MENKKFKIILAISIAIQAFFLVVSIMRFVNPEYQDIGSWKETAKARLISDLASIALISITVNGALCMVNRKKQKNILKSKELGIFKGGIMGGSIFFLTYYVIMFPFMDLDINQNIRLFESIGHLTTGIPFLIFTLVSGSIIGFSKKIKENEPSAENILPIETYNLPKITLTLLIIGMIGAAIFKDFSKLLIFQILILISMIITLVSFFKRKRRGAYISKLHRWTSLLLLILLVVSPIIAILFIMLGSFIYF